jgi:hypothetical protein
MENTFKIEKNQNLFILENGEYFPYLTFKEFVQVCEQDRLDEIEFIKNAWDSAKKGFKSAFGSWNKETDPETGKPDQKVTDPFAAHSISTTDIGKINIDAPPKDANPDAVTEKHKGLWEKLKSFAIKMKDVVVSASKMTGISAPLALAILFAGYMGGIAAVPAAVILYFTRKILMTPILGLAGKAYDKAVDVAKNVVRGPKVQTESFSVINEWTFTNDFKNYSLYKFLKTEGDISVSYKEWLSNPNYDLLHEGKVTDYLMGLIGKGAGHVTGFLSSSSKKVGKFLYNGIKSAAEWVWKWKVPIGKFLFLMAIGVLVGGAITQLTAPMVNDAVASVKTAVGMGAKVPPAQIAELNQIAKEYGGQTGNANAGMPPENFVNPDSTNAVGVAQRAADSKQAYAQGKDIVDTLVTKYGNLKQRLVDVMRDMQNPDRDAVAVMNAAQSKAEFTAAYEKATSLGSSYLRKFSDALERISQKTGKPLPDIDVSAMAPDDSAIDQFGNIVQSKTASGETASKVLASDISPGMMAPDGSAVDEFGNVIQSKAEVKSLIDTVKNSSLYKNAESLIRQKLSSASMKDIDSAMENIDNYNNIILNKHNMYSYIEKTLNKEGLNLRSWLPDVIKNKGVDESFADFLKDTGTSVKYGSQQYDTLKTYWNEVLEKVGNDGIARPKMNLEKIGEMFAKQADKLRDRKFELEQFMQGGKR